MTTSLKRAAVACVALAGLGLAGCSSTKLDAHLTSAHPSKTISVVVHHTNLVFITASGSSSPYPTGPLAPGDRVVGQDDLSQHGSTIGSGFEFCTVSFGRNVLCDYMAQITGVGDIHTTWTFQWPSSGTTGPTAWDGVVDGGTGRYANAIGDFHAKAFPGGDDNITLRIVQPS